MSVAVPSLPLTATELSDLAVKARNSAEQDRMIAQNVHAALPELLLEGTAPLETQRQAARLLANLAFQPPNKIVITEAGAVEATLAAMRGYPRAAGFQQMGRTLLHNVSAFTPSGLLRCNDGGAKAVAIAARNTHLNNEDVTIQADTVIGLLA